MSNKQTNVKLGVVLLTALTLVACNGGNSSSTATNNTSSSSPLQTYINSLTYTPVNGKQVTAAGTSQQSFVTPGALIIDSVDIKFYSGASCTGNLLYTNTLNGSLANPVTPIAGTYTSSNASNNALCGNYVNGGSSGCAGLYSDMTAGTMRSMQFTYNLNNGGVGGSTPLVGGCMYNSAAQVDGGTTGVEGIANWTSVTNNAACSGGTCGFSQPYSVNLTPSIQITTTTDQSGSVMMGSAVQFTATLIGVGSSVVTAALTNPAIGLITSNPSSCVLNSATGLSSCTFMAFTNWDTSLANGLTDLVGQVNFSVTNSILVTGNATQAVNRQTPTVYLPQTGQTPTVPLTATAGMDGFSNTGIEWAYVSSGAKTPATRFTVDPVDANCIIDNLTGLEWPQNGLIGFTSTDTGAPIAQPNYTNTTANLNNMAWESANIAITNLNSAPTKLCGYSDWYLPTVNDLLSLINDGQSSQATWLNGQGFSNVPPSTYWSSSTYALNSASADMLNFTQGSLGNNNKTTSFYVWPVRRTAAAQ